MTRLKSAWALWAVLLLGAMPNAHALQISSLSPQGEVARVRQVAAKFDAPAVAFGSTQAAAPLAISCNEAQATAGTGRWTSEREWVFDFAQDLPPGVNCTLQTRASFQSPQGKTLANGSFRFSTGGPFVQQIRPGSYEPIDEEQYVALQLNGPATLESAQANIWCSADGLGERIPIRWLAERDRAQLLKALGWDQAASKAPLRYLTFTCNRRLSPEVKVQIVYGKGVATPAAAGAAHGVANAVERRFNYQVREAFTASFSCERENAQSPCLPIRPMTLSFNAPVPRQLAEQVRLVSGSTSIKPAFDKDEGASDSGVNSLRFAAPLPQQTSFNLQLPAGFKDTSDRPLRNAESFPLKVTTGTMPPLVKFAAAPFGIVERLAEPEGGPLLPITLRRVEGALPVQMRPAGPVNALRAQDDAQIIAWYRKVQRYNAWQVSRAQARADIKVPLPKVVEGDDKEQVQSRMLPLLAGQPGVKTLQLPTPAGGDPRPFEVVGIPMAAGFHVVEVASPLLGQALLDARHGASRTMYVRTAVLVTNLGVHFKLGRESALAWVTTLDKGLPVAGARVQVSDCNGQLLVSATTDARGIADFKSLNPQPPRCKATARAGNNDAEADEEDSGREAYFVSARARTGQGAQAADDLAFTWSDWTRGIEPWRFDLLTSREPQPDWRAHSVLDRTLLRAGETVSMKHFIRTETTRGLGLPDVPPTELVITHVGSGQQFTQPLAWRKTATGGLSADSQFQLPPAARLGQYEVALKADAAHGNLPSGAFRVEEFRLPVLQGRLAPADSKPVVAATSFPVDVQVNYVAGGPATQLPVRVSALAKPKTLRFADYEAFSFQTPRGLRGNDIENADGEEDEAAHQNTRVVADKLPLTLDRNGTGRVVLPQLPASRQPQELLLEARYADPNGEIQTLRQTVDWWPAAVVAGIKTEGWVSARQQVRFQALALQLDGKPAAQVALKVRAAVKTVTTARKRMVGGFYAYDNKTEMKDLGEVCSGRSDARGLLLCEARMEEPGEVELTVTATDAQGRQVQAASSVWITHQGELWFGGENHDRMDLLPEKKSYQPGDTARFQVRMPFRQATALVAVEREGILHTEVVQLHGDDPTVSIQVKDSWGPNVYVSVLALRGRLREVPWYSFFTWGYKAPREWWNAFWYEGREYIAPTALVDLSKPAFRLGVAEIRVGLKAHELAVSVKPERDSYPVRGQARVVVQVKQPNGQPAAHAEVALAAVDEALLELMPNDSWNLLQALLQRRAWGVETATAQMEIVGRRHYGRKAVPAGGGGGKSATRELLDTLLLWNPRVVLDAQGQAVVTVPLNDALTRFRIVAVADMGTQLFGSGFATVRATQDLQIISGLPPLVREEDRFRAQFTLRNTTARAMKVQVTPRATLLTLPAQTVDIPAGEAREVAWDVTAPAQLAYTRAEALLWEIEARDTLSGGRDALKASQRLIPAVPLSVQQATLVQLDGPYTLPVAPPADALPVSGAKRGGLKLALQPRLSEGLPGVRDWFAQYPYSCLEQQVSKAIGLRDAKRWQALVAQLPTYLDSDGLANYFPPREGDANHGSDVLTAYLLAAAHEAAALDPAFALPDAVRAPMERGLAAFVEGRIQRSAWAPRSDLDVRKLAALEALSRYGQAQGRLLGSITLAPNQWPTSGVIDWLNILKRVPDAAQREQRSAEAQQVLRARLSYQGTKLIFSTESQDNWWWLMTNGDVNTARLLLAVLDDPTWQSDLGRLASGFIARQQGGAWHTTTANLWGGLALEKFSKKLEATPVAGTTRAALGAASASVDWSGVDRVKPSDSAPHATTAFGAPAAPAGLRNNTMFLPWTSEASASASASAPAANPAALSVTHTGSGKPWLTVQALAALNLTGPINAGYQIKKTVTAVEQATPGKYTRGDVLRIALEITASTDISWVVLSDPIPGGATVLGSGLGRDSQIATQGEKRSTGSAWPAFEERSFEAFRSYYEFMPKGRTTLEYTVRLNNAGDFALPPTRVEAMYAPEVFGVVPNGRVAVGMP